MGQIFGPAIDQTARNVAGYGTTWQDVTVLRAVGVVYHNTDHTTREVAIIAPVLNMYCTVQVSVDGINWLSPIAEIATNNTEQVQATGYLRIFPVNFTG